MAGIGLATEHCAWVVNGMVKGVVPQRLLAVNLGGDSPLSFLACGWGNHLRCSRGLRLASFGGCAAMTARSGGPRRFYSRHQ